MIENLIESFGEISARRRPGTLRLLGEQRSIAVRILDGRIVGIEEEGISTVEGLVQRLAAAGVLPPQVVSLVKGRKLALAQLQEVLVSRRFTTPEQFQRAKKIYELDLLYGLKSNGDWKCEFQAHNIAPDSATLDYPTPGQVLLDLLELESESQRYSEILPANKQTTIRRTATPRDGLVDCEKNIWVAIEGGCRIVDLERGMFTEFEKVVGLLALFDRNLVTIVPDQVSEPPMLGEKASTSENLKLKEEPRESLFSAIEAQLQFEGFEDLDLQDEELQSPQNLMTNGGTIVVPQSNGVSFAGTEAARLSQASPGFMPKMMEQCCVAVQDNAAEMKALGAIVGDDSRIASSSPTELPLVDWNSWLMKAELRQRIILAITLVWLATVFLASLMPDGLIERWFHALREFSSD